MLLRSMLDLIAAPIAAAAASHLGLESEQVAALIGPPNKAGAGDLALPCFQLAKPLGKAPPQVAQLAAEAISQTDGLEATAAGPFVNIRIDAGWVASTLLTALEANPGRALQSTVGAGKAVCVDFSSPNIAKHLAFHHIRSTMIGNSLARCYAAAGWAVNRINFLGDWGTAFGRLIAGWKRESLSLADLDAAADKVGFLNALYVRISKAEKEDESVAEEARGWSKKLEDGDAEARELWQIFKDASLSEFKRLYALLQVDFDSWKGEAYYEDKMQPILDELSSSGLLQEDQGAEVVDLSSVGMKKPCLIRRADGGTLYATRDLAAADDRFAEFNYDRSLYVVDLGQALHFKEWFAVAKLLNKPYHDRLRHIGFGVVLMWNEDDQAFAKGSSKAGRVMMLSEVLDEAIVRARAIIDEKNPDLADSEKDQVAQAVGVGAVVFNDLKNGRKNDVKFRFQDALNMQGETGPYLQFAQARLCSIERKAAALQSSDSDAPSLDAKRLSSDAEKNVFLHIARLQSALERAVNDDEPSVLASSLLQLASAISGWLTSGNSNPQARVLCDDANDRQARLALVAAARRALGDGLYCLGLQAPQRM